MASSAQFDDQADEDFFDKLVDDDEFAVAGADSEAIGIARDLSSLSIGDEATSVGEEDITEKAGLNLSSSTPGGVKGTSVKVVQWSAFSIDPQPAATDGFDGSSDFLTENAFAESNNTSFAEKPVEEPSIDVGSSYEQQSGEFYANEQVSAVDNAQYWENLYPGWKYDQNTGQWYQVDSYQTVGNAQPESGEVAASSGIESSGISYLQQSTSSVLETIAEDCAMSTVSSWNQGSYASNEYPPNMVFDPQYPGWYYDTNTQQWQTLETYTQMTQGTMASSKDQLNRSGNGSASFILEQNYGGQPEQYATRGLGSQEVRGTWDVSTSNYHHNVWQPATVEQGGHNAGFTLEHQPQNSYGLTENATSHTDRQRYQGFNPSESMHHFSQPKVDQSMQTHLSDSYYNTQNSTNYSHKPFQSTHGSHSRHSYVPTEGRSADGRPPHALVSFGFGGKLIVMKDNSSLATKSDFGSQGTVGGVVSIHNLTEVVMDKVDASRIVTGSSYDYFHALCQQSFPGPLTGGNAATRDVNKWIDQRIMSCESSSMDFQKGEQLRLLLSLLRISCQYYGKLRSPFGADSSLEETDGPESAVTKLFASARKNSALRVYGSSTHCIQNIPSEGQLLATSVEVQNLLVAGRRKEALQCAQEGQLWGPALVLAAQLGDKFYVDTVRQMAHHQFISGSPLRTLCLLIAGQPADVFSGDCFANSISGAVNAPQPAEIRATGMLDKWEENLSIITANRTKGDELVMIHLGDCLWKERGEINAAHTCYLVAESSFELYSDSARFCLIGADHWKFPRTFASPEAIQMTEMYEYSKVLGNSQFILLSLQPYKLIYAYMLAEVGKVADSLRYCQATLKLLKNSGRAPEVETWKSQLSSLEDRLRTHQQGGYSANLDPAKLVGKFFTSIDRSIHRMIGAPPPPLPPMPENSKSVKENYSMAPKVSNSQSTMAMSSLIPSESVEAISEWTGDGGGRKTRHNRSISEPNFGGTPKQDAQSKASSSGVPSRFGRIGSQLLQKTMGWVSRSRGDHQAKLGETNKFYYDEKLKRWVEEGAEPPADEPALAPPPTAAAFQNGTSDYKTSSASKSQGLSSNGAPEMNSPAPLEHNSGIPPIPPSQNQFSSRGRMGVRSRYVDTFNKGGGAPTNSFQPASSPSMKPSVGAKFFIPSMPVSSSGHEIDTARGTKEEATTDASPSSPPSSSSSSSSMQPSASSMPRYPSMDNINTRSAGSQQSSNGPLSLARRASWSGANMDVFMPTTDAMKPIGDGYGVPSSSIPFNNPSPIRTSSSSSLQLVAGGNAGDELHEVEL